MKEDTSLISLISERFKLLSHLLCSMGVRGKSKLNLLRMAVLAMLLLSFSSLSLAEQADGGEYLGGGPAYDPGKPYHGAGFNADVNLFSGNLIVNGPSATVSGRNGVNINFQPKYSSNSVFHDYDGSGASDIHLKEHGPLGLGWSGWHFGRIRFITGSTDDFTIPEMAVEDSDGTLHPFIVDSEGIIEDVDDHKGIFLDDGSKIIWYFGDCEDYLDPDSCGMYRYDDEDYVSDTTFLGLIHRGHVSFVRVLPSGTRMYYQHFAGPGRTEYVNWWTKAGSYATGTPSTFSPDLPSYGDWGETDDRKQQLPLIGYYVTRILDTNGNYIDFTYHNEVICHDYYEAPDEYNHCDPNVDQFDPDLSSYSEWAAAREKEIYMRSAVTFGSPYVKEARIQAFACKDETFNGVCTGGLHNDDKVEGKSYRTMTFEYSTGAGEDVNSQHARLEKVKFYRACDNGKDTISCSTESRKQSYLKFTYSDISGTTNDLFQLTEVELFDGATSTSLFPETKYEYHGTSADTEDKRRMSKITAPQGGTFEVDYTDEDENFNYDCAASHGGICTRTFAPVGETTIKESTGADEYSTKYYYVYNADFSESGGSGTHTPGTSTTYVVPPQDSTNNNGNPIRKVTYYIAYSVDSGIDNGFAYLSNNWKSGLTKKEESFEVNDFQENNLPEGDPLLGSGAKQLTKKEYYWDSVELGSGRRYDSQGNAKWYWTNKPLQDAVKTCAYDRDDTDNTYSNGFDADRTCTLTEYEYYGEFDSYNNDYKDEITFSSETSKTLYDTIFGLVKKEINYGKVGDASTYKIYDPASYAGCYRHLISGNNLCTEAYRMHGTMTVLDIDSTDNIRTEYYYQHRRPETDGKYFGFFGEEDCIKVGSTNYCHDEEIGHPEFQAIGFVNEVKVYDHDTNTLLSKASTEYDELHYSGETLAKTLDDAMWRRYSHEPDVMVRGNNVYINSVPNMNPTTTTTSVYDETSTFVEDRKTSVMYEKLQNSEITEVSSTNNYGANLAAWNFGNPAKTRKADRQADPQDDYFDDPYGVVNFRYDESNFNLIEKYEYIDESDGSGGYTSTGPRHKIYQIKNRDPITAQVVRIEDANENFKLFWYDKLGRITGTGTYPRCPDGEVCDLTESDSNTKIEYTDGTGGDWETKVEVRKSGAAFFKPTTNIYDGLGRLERAEQEDLTANCYIVSETTYDSEGKVYEKTAIPFQECSGSGSGPVARFEKYAANGIVEEMLPNSYYTGETVETEFDHESSIVIDQKGNKVKKTVDGFGRTKTVEALDSSNNVEAKTEYLYDSLGQVKEVRDANYDEVLNTRKTTYKVYSNGETKEVNNPDKGVETYVYDKLGRVVETNKEEDIDVLVEYDSLGRATKIKYKKNGVLQTDFERRLYYDDFELGIDLNSEYDDGDCNRRGRLHMEWIKDGNDEIYTEFCYDYQGRMDFLTRTIAGQKFVIEYEYDDAGNVIEEIYPDNTKVEYIYDDLGRLEKIEVDDVEVSDFEYNPSGTVDKTTYGNGVVTEYDYTNKNFVQEMTIKKGTETYYDRTYFYDKVGNVEEIWGVDDVSLVEFQYDDLYRLTNVDDKGFYGNSYVYTYDKVGNRKTVTVGSGTAEDYLYDSGSATKVAPELAANNRLLENDKFVYSYDDMGNMETRTIKNTIGVDAESFTYDLGNNLKEIKYGFTSDGWTRYWYDNTGNRVVKKEYLLTRDMDDIQAIAIGQKSDVYVAVEDGSNSDVYVCDKSGLDCKTISALNDISTVVDMYFNPEIDVLYIADDSGDVESYYACATGFCSTTSSLTGEDVVAISGISLVSDKNLILNPSLEHDNFVQAHFMDQQGSTIYLGEVGKWGFTETDSNADGYVIRDTDSYVDNYAIKIVDEDGVVDSTITAVSASYVAKATAGNVYSCSAYAKRTSTSPAGGSDNSIDDYQDLALYFLDDAKMKIASVTYANPCDGEVCTTATADTWQHYSVTETAPSGTAYVECFVNSMDGDEATYLWDGFQIEQGQPSSYQGPQGKVVLLSYTSGTTADILRYDSLLNTEENSVTITGVDSTDPPSDIAIDNSGRVVVAGHGSDKIYRYNYDFTASESYALPNVISVAVDDYGNIYAVTTDNKARKINDALTGILSLNDDELTAPIKMERSDKGIYIADGTGINGRLMKFADPLSFDPMYTFYFGTKGGNYIHERNRPTNTDTLTPYFETFKAHDAEACNQEGGCSGDTELIHGYCSSQDNGCIGLDGTCYDSNDVSAIDAIYKGFAICEDNSGLGWRDCDASQAACSTCSQNVEFNSDSVGCSGNSCWQKWKGTELGREYQDIDTTYECCGDDLGEYYAENSAGTVAGCCPSQDMEIDGSGDCVFPSGGGTGGSSPMIFKWGGSPLVMKAPNALANCIALIEDQEDCVWSGSDCYCN